MPFSVACSQQQNYYSHDKGRLSIQLKGQQPLLCKSRIQAPTGALGIRLFITLFKSGSTALKYIHERKKP